MTYFLIVLLTALAGGSFHPKSPTVNDSSESSKDIWKTIDSLEQTGFIQQAHQRLDDFLTTLDQSRQPFDWVRAHIYKARYLDLQNDQPELKGIYHLESILKTSSGAPKAVLESSLAAFYFHYALANTHMLSGRTAVPEEKQDSVEYWTMEQLIGRSNALYEASVSSAWAYRQIGLDAFGTLLTPAGNKEPLLDNLSQVLLNRAITHYFDDRSRLAEPIYAFQANRPEYFSTGDTFASVALDNSDTTSFLYKALRLFQKEYPRMAENPAWLIHMEIKRLQALQSASNLEDKTEWYEAALTNLLDKWKDTPVSVEIVFYLASHWIELGSRYQALDSTTFQFRGLPDKALKACASAIGQFPNAFAAEDCRRLIAEIKETEWEWQVENFVLPGERNLISIRYRNASQANTQMYRVTLDEWREFQRMPVKKQREFIAGKPVFRSDTFALEDPVDYQWHRTEVVSAPLDAGLYLVVLDKAVADEMQYGISFSWIHASDIDMINRPGKKGVDVWVVDRKSSCPVAGAKVKVWKNEYRNQTKSDTPTIHTTDKYGQARFSTARDAWYEIVAESDKSTTMPREVYRQDNREPEGYDRTVLFTDRNLYRPGQTVYFKGIHLKHNENNIPAIVAGKQAELILRDANAQDVARLKVRSNEFGAFHGAFTLPQGLLNGRFSIADQRGELYHSFQVEEYKRPRFAVSMEDPKDIYQLGDTIKVGGKAEMYAGVPVGEAEGTYRVSRSVYYPWFPWYRGIPEQAEEAWVAQGVLRTDPDGGFDIRFPATMPAGAGQRWKPVYQYTIQVDITDAAGETRSGSKTLSVGTVPWVPVIEKPDRLFAGQSDSLVVDIRNVAGQTQSIQAEVKIMPLKAPGLRYRKRLWDRPDMPQIGEPDFRKWFPDRPFNEEDQIENWPKGTPVLSATMNPAESKSLVLPKDLSSGTYWVELRFEAGGQQHTHADWFVVHDAKKGQWADNQEPLQLLTEKKEYQPGDSAVILTGNPWPTACVYLAVEKRGVLIREGWQKVKGMHRFSVPVGEDDRGGFFVHAFYATPEGIQVKTIQINVPWSNKDLHISWESRRDYLLPGAEETWDFTISGPGKDRVAAEMLASMYDVSLDAIAGANRWPSVVFPQGYARMGFEADYRQYQRVSSLMWRKYVRMASDWPRYIPDFRYDVYIPYRYSGGYLDMRSNMAGGVVKRSGNIPVPEMAMAESDGVDKGMADDMGGGPIEKKDDSAEQAVVQPRSNFNETAFFFPDLRTDSIGNIRFSFKMSDALTRWKLMLFAHDRQLATGYSEFLLETRKDLMVFPNVPRFVRQSDTIGLSFKVQNQLDQPQEAVLSIQIRDLISGKDLTSAWIGKDAQKQVTIPAKGAASRAPVLRIPDDFSGLLEITYSATTDRHSDAEVHVLPVLTQRMLVTETLPLWVNEKETRSFEFTAWKKQQNSTTLRHHDLVLEFSPNPAWYALQSMPYIMEYPHECTEQQMARLYANMLGAELMNRYPLVRTYMTTWQKEGALQSALQKNEGLKSALLAETPWVLDAASETEQRQRLQLLFDLNRLGQEYEKGVRRLKEIQSATGGFPWFPGGRENWYVTQYVVEKLGHLDKLGAKDVRASADLREILQKAVGYCDREAVAYYEKQKEASKGSRDLGITSLLVHYLYARSFFPDVLMSEQVRKVYSHYLDKVSKDYMQLNLQDQALGAISLHRSLRGKEAANIVRSGLERSVYNEEMGRFWKMADSWFWYAQPIETQTAWIEAVDEVLKDAAKSNELRRWLLKQKQTTHWPSTVSTAKSIYVLLAANREWVESKPDLRFRLSGKEWTPDLSASSPGSGYFKTTLVSGQLDITKPTIELINGSASPGWGGLYWQYFEDLDKITTFKETPLRLSRTLFIKRQTDRGLELVPITSQTPIQVGDRITVRIDLRVDRAMEFVHLKDMRASGLEPIDAISGYQWRSGLGFYQAVRDQAVDFFFDYLAPGTYVFEYDLRAFHAGQFSNGISRIQSMYAPEFSSHSAGIRINIKNQ
jgi:hypothetical protein